jgi:hypothetical protein
VFWWLSSDLKRLAQEQLRYNVQAGVSVLSSITIFRLIGVPG